MFEFPYIVTIVGRKKPTVGQERFDCKDKGKGSKPVKCGQNYRYAKPSYALPRLYLVLEAQFIFNAPCSLNVIACLYVFIYYDICECYIYVLCVTIV